MNTFLIKIQTQLNKPRFQPVNIQYSLEIYQSRCYSPSKYFLSVVLSFASSFELCLASQFLNSVNKHCRFLFLSFYYFSTLSFFILMLSLLTVSLNLKNNEWEKIPRCAALRWNLKQKLSSMYELSPKMHAAHS